MAHLKWSSDWATGFQDIDEQHQNLINQINKLKDIRAQSDAMQVMQALFDFVADAMNHFAYEEEMLKEANYKLVETRHAAHENFTNRLLSYQERVFEDLTVMDELLPQIETWIQRHIELNDRIYVNAVKASGIYVENQQGILERPSMAHRHEGSFQDAAVEIDEPQIAKMPVSMSPFELVQVVENNENKKVEEDDDIPRSWARGV